LRVLQEKHFERVGGSQTLSTDVRIIAATNRNLKEAIAEKEFRQDLFYRLNVFTISLPPLRDRGEDVPQLVEHFIKKYCSETGKCISEITPEGMLMLQHYPWPGNIRELENCIERAVILCNGRTILPQHLLFSEEMADITPAPAPAQPAPTNDMRTLAEVEREHVLRVLENCENNQTKAAGVLGIDRKTLRNKLREFGV
jgi:two-component system response regulator HydG